MKLHIIGASKTEERENTAEAIFEEIIAMNFPKLIKDISGHDFKRHCKLLTQ